MSQENTSTPEVRSASTGRGGLFCSSCNDIYGCTAEGKCQKKRGSLGRQIRDYSETLSVFTVLKDEFFAGS